MIPDLRSHVSLRVLAVYHLNGEGDDERKQITVVDLY